MKEFFKKRYNILIPIFLLIVLLIAILLYTMEYKNNRYANIEEVDVYQYFSGIKMEYKANVSRNKKDVILDFENKEYVVSLDSTPIYIEDKDNVIFPKEMSIVFPLKDEQYRVNALAEIYKKYDLYYLNIRDINDNYEHAFFFDGNNLYFFIDTVNLVVGDKTIELSPMSYVSAIYGNFIEYYDYANDTYGKLDISNYENVTIKNDYMTVELTVDKVIYNDGFTFLTSDFGYLAKINDIDK